MLQKCYEGFWDGLAVGEQARTQTARDPPGARIRANELEAGSWVEGAASWKLEAIQPRA